MTDLTHDKIYDMYHSKVFSYVKARVNNHQDAEDITSDVFLKIISAYSTYDCEKAMLSTWIYTIAANTIRDHLRRAAVRLKNSCEITEEHFDSIFSENESLSEEFLREETLGVLTDALKSLSEKERMIIIMHYYKNISHKEIAEHMNLGYSNVRFINHKALEKIRAFMKGKGYF